MMLIEKSSFWFLVDPALKTNYEPFIIVTPDLLAIFKVERLEGYDDSVDFCWSEILEDG